MNNIKIDEPIAHNCHNGTVFRSTRADLQMGVDVHFPPYLLSTEEIIADAAEFGAWFGLHIHPELPSFQGTGSIKYKVAVK